jgi:hypothetical protein
MSKFVSELDKNLPMVHPFTGEVTVESMRYIKDILSIQVFDSKPIRTQMEKERLAVVGSIARGTKHLDTSKRMCHRRTFSNKIIRQFAKTLLPQLKQQFNSIEYKNDTKPIDIRIDPTHGDVLYYDGREHGFFKEHRDLTLPFPFKDVKQQTETHEWRMYSMVLCLDSNISRNSKQGNTTMFLPNKKRTFNHKTLITHSFSDTHMYRRYLVFPSEAIHRSDVIMNSKYYKMALKVDLWLNVPKLQTTILENRLKQDKYHKEAEKAGIPWYKYIVQTNYENTYDMSLCYCDFCCENKKQIMATRHELKKDIQRSLVEIILGYCNIESIVSSDYTYRYNQPRCICNGYHDCPCSCDGCAMGSCYDNDDDCNEY